MADDVNLQIGNALTLIENVTEKVGTWRKTEAPDPRNRKSLKEASSYS